MNIEGLTLIMHHYYKPKERYMSKKDAINLVSKDTNINLYDKDAMYCYGMSKMTVSDEVKYSKRYEKLELSEFCEFVGRVADVKYKEQTEYSLAKKIEFILDDMFKLVNYKRKEIDDVDDEVSASDSDY